MRRKKGGFTLIELLVVVLIIGILAAVALPQYQLSVRKTRVMKTIALAKPFWDAQERIKMATGSYTYLVSNLDVDCPWTVSENEYISQCISAGSAHTRQLFTFTRGYFQYRCETEKVGFNWLYGSKEIQLFLFDDISRKLCSNLQGEIRIIDGEERCVVPF